MKITPEMVEALRKLRSDGRYHGVTRPFRDAFDVLDNAGVFKAIDEHTGYDVEPEAKVSKCTCPKALVDHLRGCPGDPAEWGDSAYRRV